MTLLTSSDPMRSESPKNDTSSSVGRTRRSIRTLYLRSGSLGGLFGAFILVLFIVMAVFGHWLEPFNPNNISGGFLSGSSTHHLFGTDELGRDELSRVIAAASDAVLSAFSAVAIAAIGGLILGLISGFWARSWVDGGISRFVDFLFCIPEIIGAVIVITVLGAGLWSASLAIGIIYTPRFSRIVRTATMDVATRSYIDAARLSKRSNFRIIVDHVLPNITSPLAVMVAMSLSNAAATYAALSFLGFAIAPPQADYGSMLGAAEPYLRSDPMLVVWPSLALVLLILAFNLVGDWVRDRLARRAGDFLQATVARP
jgi:peptide/nickel transport system permease protein